jgi:hypothetical protein
MARPQKPPFPTTHHKDRLFHSRHTRPITLKVSNAMMEACFSLLTATKQWPEIDKADLGVARQKAIDAFQFWRRTHGGPGTGVYAKRKRKPKQKKEKAHESNRQQPTSHVDADPGLLPGDFAGQSRE